MGQPHLQMRMNIKNKKAIALLLAILMTTSSTSGLLSMVSAEENSSSYTETQEDEQQESQTINYLNIGDSYQLPTDGSKMTVSDTEAFTVNEETKLLTANEFGSGNVTIGYEDGTNKVYEFVVTCKIEAAESSVNITQNSTYQITLNNLLDEFKDEVTWESSDTEIATVDENGLVTAKNNGSAKIKATFYKDEVYEYSAEINVNVVAENVTNDFVFEEETMDIEFKSTKSLKYNTSIDVEKITWETEDENVAVVTNGIVSSIGPGETKINAVYNKGESDEAILDSCTVKTIGSISINEIDTEKENVKIYKSGDVTICSTEYGKTMTLGINTVPDSILEDENYSKFITWETSNEDAVTVDSKGTINVVGFGSSTIKVTLFKDTASEVSDEIVISVPIEMEVTPSFESLQLGEKLTLDLYSSSEAAIKDDYKWKSSDESIATVDENTGEVTAIGAGTVIIYPQSDVIDKVQKYLSSQLEATETFEDTHPVRCIIEVEGTTITKTDISMYIGKTKDLNDNKLLDAAIAKYETTNGVHIQKGNTSTESSDVSPSDVSPSDVISSNTSELIWISSDDKIVSIDGSIASAVDYGQVTVTPYVKTNEGNVALVDEEGNNLAFIINVNYKFSMEESKTIKIGESSKINCTGLPLDTILNESNATWKSTDESVATVDNEGNVTAIAPGVCYIIFTSKEINRAEKIISGSEEEEDFEYSCQISSEYSFDVTSEAQTLGVFESKKIEYELDPYEIHNQIKWSSSNEDVATVDSDGNVYTVGFGQATITAKLFDTVETVDFTVSYENSTPETSEEKTINIGNTDTIDISKYIPEDSEIDSSNFRWMSTNENVLTVDENGKVTAVGLGSAEIVAGVVSGSLTANYYSCKYNVVCDLELESTKNIAIFDSIYVKDIIKNISSEDCISNVKWTINDESIATIDGLGIITANKVGKTKIVGEISGKTYECELNIAYDLGLELNSVKIILGDSFKLSSIYNSDNSSALRNSLKYEITDTDVAEIKDEEIVGKKFGTTKMKITSEYFDDVYEIEITIGYDFAMQADTNVSLGSNVNMVSSTKPEDLDVVWASSNEDVATVDENGTVTTLNVGETEITATVIGKDVYKAKVTVTLDAKLESESKVLVKGTVTPRLSLPENLIPDEIVWSSSDEGIAAVDETGKVTGVKAGIATITAKVKYKNFEQSYSTDITVDDIALEAIDIQGDTAEIDLSSENKLIKLSILTTPSDATGLGNVTWKSLDENIAIVDDDGNVVGINPGTVMITAEINGKTNSYVINVIKSIKSVDIEFDYEQISVDNQYQAILKINPEDTTATVTPVWSSSNESILTVNENGLVNTVNKGTAKLKVSVGEFEKEIEIVVGGIDIPTEPSNPIISDSDMPSVDEPIVSDSDIPSTPSTDKPSEDNNLLDEEPTISDSDIDEPEDLKNSENSNSDGSNIQNTDEDKITDIDTGENITSRIIAGVLMAIAAIGGGIASFFKFRGKKKNTEEFDDSEQSGEDEPEE